MNTLPDFLRGAIDLHVHSAPDVDARRFNDIELAREAARSGRLARCGLGRPIASSPATVHRRSAVRRRSGPLPSLRARRFRLSGQPLTDSAESRPPA